MFCNSDLSEVYFVFLQLILAVEALNGDKHQQQQEKHIRWLYKSKFLNWLKNNKEIFKYATSIMFFCGCFRVCSALFFKTP